MENRTIIIVLAILVALGVGSSTKLYLDNGILKDEAEVLIQQSAAGEKAAFIDGLKMCGAEDVAYLKSMSEEYAEKAKDESDVQWMVAYTFVELLMEEMADTWSYSETTLNEMWLEYRNEGAY